MNPLTEFVVGLQYFLRGLELIREPRLRPFVLIPLAINVVLIVALASLFGWQLHSVLESWLAGLPGWLDWLQTLLWWVGLILAVLLFCYLFTFLANLIASPFNGVLSARVELLLMGHEPDSNMSFWQEMADAVTGEIKLAVFSLGRACLLGLVCLALLFIPVINAAIPFLWFAFGAYMLAFEYLDGPMGNRGLEFAAKRAHVGSRRWRHLGFGSVVTLVTAIPLLNLIVMPAAVAGATALYLDTTTGLPEA